MQYQARIGPIVNEAATITVDMLQGCLPVQRPRARGAQSALFSVPEVSAFANESTIGWHSDTPRLPKNARGPSFFPFSGTAAPDSPEMFAGSAPDRPNRVTRRFASVFFTPEVEPFSIESVFASRPERPRLLLGPRIGQPLSQPTHTDAPQSIEMTAGSMPSKQRYAAPRHDGWQWFTPEVPVFSIEMVIGSHPDKPRLLLGQQPASQPVGETGSYEPVPPPPPVDTGATPGWPGSDDTPGYTRGQSQGWINRDYIRQPSQRPGRRVKPVPEPTPPVARQPLARVPYVPQGPPMRAQARVVGGTGGVGQARGLIAMVATVVVRPAAGMVAQARSTKAKAKMTQADWFALKIALSDD